MMFGGVTIVCGIVGTISGGFILDQMGATISNAFKVSSVVSQVFLDHGMEMASLSMLLAKC